MGKIVFALVIAVWVLPTSVGRTAVRVDTPTGTNTDPSPNLTMAIPDKCIGSRPDPSYKAAAPSRHSVTKGTVATVGHQSSPLDEPTTQNIVHHVSVASLMRDIPREIFFERGIEYTWEVLAERYPRTVHVGIRFLGDQTVVRQH